MRSAQSEGSRRPVRGLRRLGWVLAMAAAPGCGRTGLDTFGVDGDGSGSGADGRGTLGGAAGGSSTHPPGVTVADKVDLLLMIDNSISMADKQEFLSAAVPALVSRLVNPVCVDPDTGAQSPPPRNAEAPCPKPLVREFAPLEDLHVGIVSSSLGSYGADACVPRGQDPERDEEQDDHGHLIGARPRALDLGLAGEAEGTPGFLQWNIAGAKQQDATTFVSTFQDLVVRTGEKGCGYEASLEAWYRFLVDPNPPQQIVAVQCPNSSNECAQAQGTDQKLLAQRKAFLRPDSLLTVVILSDENDCSVQGTGQLYYAVRNIDLPRPSSACAADPNDKCCYSCAFRVPDGCPADPACDGSVVPSGADNRNLRCWNQKQRFGVDFLYPVERYVNALTQYELCPEVADLSSPDCQSPVPNPIFTDLSGRDRPVRDPSLVLLAGIVGVPWQDIVADVDESGHPVGPLDTDGDGTVDNVRYLTARQMRGAAADGIARDTWRTILGDPAASPPLPPADPLMLESMLPRSGVNPATGAALARPSAGPLANPINGHEWNVLGNDDLQFACIFPITPPRDCEQVYASGRGCDCLDLDYPVGDYMNPLCQDASGTYGTTQHYAKAHPGLRHLEVLRGMGDNAVVTSICPPNATDPSVPAYGYGPTVAAIIGRMNSALAKE